MNLVDFVVTAIIEEKRGKCYELYGMTKEQAEAEPDNDFKYILFLDGVKQTYEYNCYGRITQTTEVFPVGLKTPYYVGYRGLCQEGGFYMRHMRPYGEAEHGGKYILDDYVWSRNHNKAIAIRRWKRGLKKKARSHMRQQLHRELCELR